MLSKKKMKDLSFIAVLVLCLTTASVKSHAEQDMCANENFIRDMRAASQQGVAVAQAGLASCYLHGVGVAQSYTEAAKWYEKAAQQGDANAQYLMGWLYDTGKGVTKNPHKAFEWHLLAAKQGDRASQLFVGMAYLDGKGVHQNDAAAAAWLERSARRGVEQAQSILSGLYFTGKGVAQNDEEAYFWISLAAKSGDVIRTSSRKEIKSNLTAEEVQRVQERLKAWRPLPDMTPP